MKKQPQDSGRASALQVALAVGLVCLALVLVASRFASASTPNRTRAVDRPASTLRASNADLRSSRGDLAFEDNAMRQLDEHGYRPIDIGLARPRAEKSRSPRGTGNGAWSSLGPPGGDVTDAAISTIDSSIVLA